MESKYDPDEFFDRKRQNKLTDCADCVTRNCMFRNRSADDVCRWFTPKKPQTNADRIRKMSDEELALWLFKNNACVDFPTYKCNGKPCHDCWLDWLQQEVGTNDN